MPFIEDCNPIYAPGSFPKKMLIRIDPTSDNEIFTFHVIAGGNDKDQLFKELEHSANRGLLDPTTCVLMCDVVKYGQIYLEKERLIITTFTKETPDMN